MVLVLYRVRELGRSSVRQVQNIISPRILLRRPVLSTGSESVAVVNIEKKIVEVSALSTKRRISVEIGKI